MTETKDNVEGLAELKQLCGAMCNGTLTDSQRERLTKRLRADAAARRVYVDYMLVHAKLMEAARIDRYSRGEDLLEDGSRLSDGLPDGLPAGLAGIACELSPAATPRGGSAGMYRALAVAVALAASLVLMLSLHGVSSRNAPPTKVGAFGALAKQTPAAPSSSTPHSSNLTQAEAPLYVAQISGLTKDVRWRDSTAAQEFLLRVRRGDHLRFESGLVELEYFSGARIILKGPCEFVATGSSSGRLLAGELTGHVSIGDFSLTTPTAKVIDLGTAFGVTLDPAGNTDVCVLDGKVRVSNDASALGDADSQLLEKGAAVRIARGSGITRLLDLKAEHFVQSLPKATPSDGEVSLVGVLSGLSGDRFRLAGVIAADTGESDRHPWLRHDGPGHDASNGFRSTSWHPFIDGIFIPSAEGGATKLTSSGHTAALPPSMGRTWGPVWSRMRIDGDTATATQEDFWGTDTLKVVIEKLTDCETGMIGLHANVGVTFDLAAIAETWGGVPSRFKTMISNLDNSMQRIKIDRKREWALKNRFSASLRVYADGQLRESRLDFTREDGELTVDVELKPTDRFLTIVSSDAGQYLKEEIRHGHDAFDHVVLIDPTISF